MASVTYDHVYKRFGEVTAVNDMNVDIGDKEFLVLVGPSGCGKSTLLNIIGLLDNPSEGDYFFFDENVAPYSEAKRSEIRKMNIGFIFQSFNLIGDLTVFENVELPLTYRGMRASERRTRVAEALERVGMGHRGKHLPSQLSGGQQQRVAVARAIVSKPDIVLADEPTANLDQANTARVERLVADWRRDTGGCALWVSHDPQQRARVATSQFEIEGGVLRRSDAA